MNVKFFEQFQKFEVFLRLIHTKNNFPQKL